MWQKTAQTLLRLKWWHCFRRQRGVSYPWQQEYCWKEGKCRKLLNCKEKLTATGKHIACVNNLNVLPFKIGQGCWTLFCSHSGNIYCTVVVTTQFHVFQFLWLKSFICGFILAPSFSSLNNSKAGDHLWLTVTVQQC